jgi:hypothetical protein
MVDQFKSMLGGNFFLQPLNLLIVKLDNSTGFDIDEMVMMLIGYFLVARTAVAKVMSLDDACLLKQLHRTIHRRNRNLRILARGAAMDLLDIRMIVGTDRTRAMTRRCSVIFIPRSIQSFSRRVSGMWNILSIQTAS